MLSSIKVILILIVIISILSLVTNYFVINQDNNISSITKKKQSNNNKQDELNNNYYNTMEYWYRTDFPMKPMSVQELKLCNNLTEIVIKSTLYCPQDETCRQCQLNPGKDYRNLKAAFNDYELKKQRLKLLKNLLKTHSNKYNETFFADEEKLLNINKDYKNKNFADFTQSFQDIYFNKPDIVLMAVNYGQVFLLLNWACHALYKLNIDVRDFTLITTSDAMAGELLESHGFAVLPYKWITFDKIKKHIRPDYKGRAMHGSHGDINNLAQLVAREFIEYDVNLILQDVDVIWNKDPRPYFHRHSLNLDMLATPSRALHHARSPINTGMLYIKSTPYSKVVLGTIDNIGEIKMDSDQLMWNSLLKHRKFHQYSWRLLPKDLFKTYVSSKITKEQKQIVLDQAYFVHAVSDFKTEQFKRIDSFFFTKDRCPKYYNSSIPIIV